MRPVIQAVFTVACILLLQSILAADTPTRQLHELTHATNPAFDWSAERTLLGEGCTETVIDLTAQVWRNEDEVDAPVWRHWLEVLTPENLRHETVLLVIQGGSRGKPAPSEINSMWAPVAAATHSRVAVLRNVPCQPLQFHGEKQTRVEDSLLARSWVKYLETGDPQWIAHIAMVRSVVGAMDAIQQWSASGEESAGPAVRDFVVVGASKRGWTAWLTAAADVRVRAVIPVVIEMPNITRSMRHHYAAYGFWAPALTDYVRQGLMMRLFAPSQSTDNNRVDRLLSIVDPYAHRRVLTMPKYMISASGDQFFLPDSSRHYFDDLLGPAYMRVVPNTGHGLEDSDVMESIAAFHSAVVRDIRLPEPTWSRTATGALVHTKIPPMEVRLWQAHNPEARDFRIDRLGPEWSDAVLEDTGRSTYEARIATPETGWTAFFVEITYASGMQAPLKFTTPVWVAPDTLPFSDKPIEANIEPVSDRHDRDTRAMS